MRAEVKDLVLVHPDRSAPSRQRSECECVQANPAANAKDSRDPQRQIYVKKWSRAAYPGDLARARRVRDHGLTSPPHTPTLNRSTPPANGAVHSPALTKHALGSMPLHIEPRARSLPAIGRAEGAAHVGRWARCGCPNCSPPTLSNITWAPHYTTRRPTAACQPRGSHSRAAGPRGRPAGRVTAARRGSGRPNAIPVAVLQKKGIVRGSHALTAGWLSLL